MRTGFQQFSVQTKRNSPYSGTDSWVSLARPRSARAEIHILYKLPIAEDTAGNGVAGAEPSHGDKPAVCAVQSQDQSKHRALLCVT